MRSSSSLPVVLACLAAALAAAVEAAPPLQLGVEGKLVPERRDTGGGRERLANMRVTIEDSAGAALHVEDLCGVEVIGGDAEFAVTLGVRSPLAPTLDGPLHARVQACFDREGCAGITDVSACEPRDYVEAIVPLDPVAYALVAHDCDLIDGLDSDALLQDLSFAHPMLSISDGNSVDLGSLANASVGFDDATRTLSVADGSGVKSADLSSLRQTVSRSGLNVTLSNGGGTFSVADDDSSPSNELQALSRSGSTVSLSNGGGSVSVDDADASPTNEIQSISRSGSTLTLSAGGGSVSVDDADASPTNEIQTLSLSGSQLAISGGNSVALPGDNLGSHVATQALNMSGQDLQNARRGGFGDLGQFSNHEVSSRVAAGNTSVDVAIFGSNEATTGSEVGVYGRTQSPAGWGVYSEGNLGTTGRLAIGNVPPASDPVLLTVDPGGNVRQRTVASLETYYMGEIVDGVDPNSYQTWDMGCPVPLNSLGGGAFDDGAPDLYCHVQATGQNGSTRYETRIVCGGPSDGEIYRWTLTCGRP